MNELFGDADGEEGEESSGAEDDPEVFNHVSLPNCYQIVFHSSNNARQPSNKTMVPLSWNRFPLLD